ncbi:DUF397 domain-containing protein [Streptomyces sp. NPDC087850]|uniref:DUF397 domain-containing protein n=1 Tax=unclassified Streptomyces TaxID=2593676 RepID=UPI0038294F8D
MPDARPRASWRKSSYSGDQGNCVEVADGLPGLTPIRDSKTPGSPALLFTNNSWTTFLTTVKAAHTA